MRLPLPLVAIAKRKDGSLRAGDINAFLDVSAHSAAAVPLMSTSAACGFPSPADDYMDRPLDFNELLVENPAATFAVRISGESMRDKGLYPGDIAVVDRARSAVSSSIVLGLVGGEFTIKTYRMKSSGIVLEAANPSTVRRHTSVVMEWIIHELRGSPCFDLELHSPDRKSIMATRSFGAPVAQRREMEEAVASHTARAAEKMRRQGLATASLIVFAHTNRHRPDQRQYGATRPVQLTVATADTGRLTKAAMFGGCIWRDGLLYKKAGVVFPTLIRAGAVQGSLFLHPDDPRSKTLMASIDTLNRRYGRGTVAYGTATGAKGWTLRAEHLSARYTTRWGDLLAVGEAKPRWAASPGVPRVETIANPPAPLLEIPAVPSMPALETYEIVQDDDDTYAVVFARTGTVVHFNGIPQLGLALDRADDVADDLEALDRIAAACGTERLDS